MDALRYTGFVTSPFHGNVQFDRHPTEWGGWWFFGVERVYGTLTQGAVEDARGAAYAVWGIVWLLVMTCQKGRLRSWR